MALSVPLDDVNSYPKLSKAYYSFIEILFRSHKKRVFALDTNVFLQIMTTVHEGLQSSDQTISSFCANAIDHLTTYYFNNQGKDKVEMHNLTKVSREIDAWKDFFKSDICYNFSISFFLSTLSISRHSQIFCLVSQQRYSTYSCLAHPLTTGLSCAPC